MARPKELSRRVAFAGAPLVLLVVAALTLFACCCPRPASPTARLAPVPSPPVGQRHFDIPEEAVPAPRTQVQMRNVHFRLDPTVALQIHALRGSMYDKVEGRPLNLDDKRSFIVNVLRARAGVSNRGLSDLLNRYVFDYEKAPLKNLTVIVHDGRLVIEGVIHKLVDLPFTMSAAVTLDDGWLRIQPVDIDVCNVDGDRLMRSFGLTLESILKPLPKGVRAQKNDLLIDPLQILPPPAIAGNITAIELHENELTLLFTSEDGAPDLVPTDPSEPNWMYFRDGTLRMGKLFMVRADMQVIDAHPADTFDFFLDFYNNQLVEGYVRNTPDYALRAFMRDYADLGAPRREGERLAPR